MVSKVAERATAGDEQVNRFPVFRPHRTMAPVSNAKNWAALRRVFSVASAHIPRISVFQRTRSVISHAARLQQLRTLISRQTVTQFTTTTKNTDSSEKHFVPTAINTIRNASPHTTKCLPNTSNLDSTRPRSRLVQRRVSTAIQSSYAAFE